MSAFSVYICLSKIWFDYRELCVEEMVGGGGKALTQSINLTDTRQVSYYLLREISIANQ